MEAGTFIDAGKGTTISAEEVDQTGRILNRVFVLQEEDEGAERILTAERGVLIPDKDSRTLRLRLENGVAVSIGRQEGEVSVRFDSLMLEREFDLDGELFRPRGDSERELTMDELLSHMRGENDVEPEPRYAAEFHGRLIRALALLGVPLIAVPLAVAGKRSPAWRRVAVAMTVLVVFQNLTKTVEGMASNGKFDPALSLWGLFAAYFAVGLWLFFSTASQGSDNAVRKFFVLFDHLVRRLRFRKPEAER